MSSDVTCSIVVPVFNENDGLAALYRRVTDVMTRAGVSYELVLVDDGSKDGSLETMRGLRKRDERVTIVELSRNFGHQVAITAGMDHARGDAVVVMDADLQDPPETIPEMLARWREGYDVVYGSRVARNGETAFKKVTATLFYRIIRLLTAVDIPSDTGDFRLMSRRAVASLRRLPERNRFVRGLSAWIGYRQTAVRYERAPRFSGETKYPLRKMVRFASDALVSFSVAPLRLATMLGLTVSLASFAYGAYAIYLKLIAGESLPGWASVIVAVVFLGGVQLLCLGIVGEYLGRVYDEVKARPLYFVSDYLAGEAIDREREKHDDVDSTSAA